MEQQCELLRVCQVRSVRLEAALYLDVLQHTCSEAKDQPVDAPLFCSMLSDLLLTTGRQIFLSLAQVCNRAQHAADSGWVQLEGGTGLVRGMAPQWAAALEQIEQQMQTVTNREQLCEKYFT